MSTTSNPMTQFWARLQGRERWAIAAAVSTVLLAAVWLGMVQPALKTLATSAAQHAVADAQLANMQRLAAQAQVARASAPIGPDEGLRLLEALVKSQLGAGSGMYASGDQAIVTLKSVPAPNLVTFVQGARVQARALPVQASLQRSTGPTTSTAVHWDGRITLRVQSGP